MQYIIIPNKDFVSEPIEATSAEDAMATFAAVMDSDMNNYFIAVPVDNNEFDKRKE